MLQEAVMLVTSACNEYEAEATDRYYLRELVEDVSAEHVEVTTHYGRLRGVRINGVPAAGQHSSSSSPASSSSSSSSSTSSSFSFSLIMPKKYEIKVAYKTQNTSTL